MLNLGLESLLEAVVPALLGLALGDLAVGRMVLDPPLDTREVLAGLEADIRLRMRRVAVVSELPSEDEVVGIIPGEVELVEPLDALLVALLEDIGGGEVNCNAPILGFGAPIGHSSASGKLFQLLFFHLYLDIFGCRAHVHSDFSLLQN